MKKIPGNKICCIRLTPDHRHTARALGDGNISLGVRRLLDYAKNGGLTLEEKRSTNTTQASDLPVQLNLELT